MINAINISKLAQSGFQLPKDNLGYIIGLKQINVFIGTNNSGKSRLLREILKADDSCNFYDNDSLNGTTERQFNDLIQKIVYPLTNIQNHRLRLKNIETIISLKNALINSQKAEIEILLELFKHYQYLKVEDVTDLEYSTNPNVNLSNLLSTFHVASGQIKQFISRTSNKNNIKLIYIPILRGVTST